MTSAGEAAVSPPLPAAVGGHRRSPLDRLPPPANTTKPLTPFGIEDILGRPRGGSPPRDRHRSRRPPRPDRAPRRRRRLRPGLAALGAGGTRQ
ncbi:hypothetical protein DUI87_09687 [Hirundo rustica rustica]|uniref:Uncharacterized protein n=1 Tax=Hirundo rustica rustica TaxID=333673 RepID=A0A3M0KMY0_HIRRU|nr:hypothetical protein DUI87_09687 [Hirundo rustica rustica]